MEPFDPPRRALVQQWGAVLGWHRRAAWLSRPDLLGRRQSIQEKRQHKRHNTKTRCEPSLPIPPLQLPSSWRHSWSCSSHHRLSFRYHNEQRRNRAHSALLELPPRSHLNLVATPKGVNFTPENNQPRLFLFLFLVRTDLPGRLDPFAGFCGDSRRRAKVGSKYYNFLGYIYTIEDARIAKRGNYECNEVDRSTPSFS